MEDTRLDLSIFLYKIMIYFSIDYLYCFSLNFYIKSIAKGVAQRIKNANKDFHVTIQDVFNHAKLIHIVLKTSIVIWIIKFAIAFVVLRLIVLADMDVKSQDVLRY